MRDRVVDVQQIQVIQLRNLSHTCRQSEVIGWIIEKWITRNLDLVIVDIRFRSSQADRLRVGNEVNVVPALRQFQTQLRGDNATPTIRRIAGDSDLHSRRAVLSWFFLPSRSLSFDGKDKLRMQILCGISLGKTKKGDAGSSRRGRSKAGGRAESAEVKVDYCSAFRPRFVMPGSSLSRWACSRFLDSSGNPVNSIPMPTPGSRVRTVAEADTDS